MVDAYIEKTPVTTFFSINTAGASLKDIFEVFSYLT